MLELAMLKVTLAVAKAADTTHECSCPVVPTGTEYICCACCARHDAENNLYWYHEEEKTPW